MNLQDAQFIAEDLRSSIEPVCETGMTLIVGSTRRKKMDVHDIEILAKPTLQRPPAEFGRKELLFKTHLDKLLYFMEQDGRLKFLSGGEKRKTYQVRLSTYGLQESLNGFKVEFYLITPPAQWGVGAVIRTGPGSPEDNFSKYCVTNRSFGGALPDGYKIKHLGVWTLDQLDAKGEPLIGAVSLSMPSEEDFLNFLGLGWIEPRLRHAPRR